MLNYSNIARAIGIDVKTAQAWMGILEKSGLVYLMHPYSPNITKRIIKTPKMYFLDTGLCAYLTKWLTPDSLMMGAMAGSILETYAVGEILKSYFHNGRDPTEKWENHQIGLITHTPCIRFQGYQGHSL